MAYISFQPSDFFNTILYTGNGSTQSLTGVGFQPDMNWVKGRDTSENHEIADAVRGATKYVAPNGSSGEGTDANALTSFDADGVSIGSWSTYNNNSSTFVMWNWKAGTTSGLSGGTITPSSYSINTTSGFGMYKFTGTGSNGTIAHGLGVTPGLVIVKRIDGTAGWQVQHRGLSAATGVLYLNTTHSEQSEAAMFNSTRPTSTVFSLGTASETNGSGNEYMAYVWAPVKGYSRFGTFSGNGSATNGPFVYTGFRPGHVLVKAINYTAAWIMFDSKRLGYNPTNKVFTPNTADDADAAWMSDIYSNGFRPFSSDPAINGAYNYVYAAFSEFPIVSSNSKAGPAR